MDRLWLYNVYKLTSWMALYKGDRVKQAANKGLSRLVLWSLYTVVTLRRPPPGNNETKNNSRDNSFTYLTIKLCRQPNTRITIMLLLICKIKATIKKRIYNRKKTAPLKVVSKVSTPKIKSRIIKQIRIRNNK